MLSVQGKDYLNSQKKEFSRKGFLPFEDLGVIQESFSYTLLQTNK